MDTGNIDLVHWAMIIGMGVGLTGAIVGITLAVWYTAMYLYGLCLGMNRKVKQAKHMIVSEEMELQTKIDQIRKAKAETERERLETEGKLAQVKHDLERHRIEMEAELRGVQRDARRYAPSDPAAAAAAAAAGGPIPAPQASVDVDAIVEAVVKAISEKIDARDQPRKAAGTDEPGRIRDEVSAKRHDQVMQSLERSRFRVDELHARTDALVDVIAETIATRRSRTGRPTVHPDDAATRMPVAGEPAPSDRREAVADRPRTARPPTAVDATAPTTALHPEPTPVYADDGPSSVIVEDVVAEAPPATAMVETAPPAAPVPDDRPRRPTLRPGTSVLTDPPRRRTSVTMPAQPADAEPPATPPADRPDVAPSPTRRTTDLTPDEEIQTARSHPMGRPGSRPRPASAPEVDDELFGDEQR